MSLIFAIVAGGFFGASIVAFRHQMFVTGVNMAVVGIMCLVALGMATLT